jgi:hypothetical protein
VPEPTGNRPQKHRRSVLTAETTGLIIVAVLILILILIRNARLIPWGAR